MVSQNREGGRDGERVRARERRRVRVSFLFLFSFSVRKTSHAFGSHFKGRSTAAVCIYQAREGGGSPQMNTDQVHRLYFLPFCCCICYWLIDLREEILLTQTLSKFLKKIPALNGKRGSSRGSKKSLIFHLKELLNIWRAGGPFNPWSAGTNEHQRAAHANVLSLIWIQWRAP